ncbi:MAG: EAL domain-containing protein [Acidimicrobiia bacterium]
MSELITRSVLGALRKQFDMDVAFISEFRQDERVFRFVDTEDLSCPVKVDASDPLGATFCARVVDGTLPELIHDAASHPVAREIPATEELPVGAHLSVPIRFSNGRVYGTLCCFRYTSDPTLGEDSVRMLRALASFVAIVLEEAETERGESALVQARIHDLIADDALVVVYQPIVDLETRTPVGVEALARFPDERGPDRWFAEAWRHDAGVELEHAAIRRALEQAQNLPETLYLSVNLSPLTLARAEVLETLLSGRVDRLVVEITEHAAVDDPASLRRALRDFKKRGGRVAVDDVGMGFSGLHQLVELSPDIIKLDRTLISGIDNDGARRAIVASLLTYATEVEATVVTEGVETAGEARTLADLGVSSAQGYHLGRPAALANLDLG